MTSTSAELTNLPIWRSLLFVPVHSEKFVAKAHTRGADAIVLDLEDSVPMPEKAQARSLIEGTLPVVSQSGADVMVRINHPLRLSVRDLESVIVEGVRAIVVPKVTSRPQIEGLDELVTELEMERGLTPGNILFIAQIESPDALLNLDEIAIHPRVAVMSIGSEDFSAAVGMEPTDDTLLLPNQQVVMAARRHNCLPYGFIGSIADFNPISQFEEKIIRARQFGFVGALAIHPDQVAVMNKGFMPTDTEIEYAQRVVDGFKKAVQDGKGAFSLDGKMIDKPAVDRANALLAMVRRFN